MRDEPKRRRHPSYGMLQIHHQRHGDIPLHGSSIRHGNSIKLSIHPGSVERDLSRDWHFADAMPIIEVTMSQSQFAEAITHTNQGSGTPVTITHYNGKPVAPDAFINKRLELENEFEEKMHQLSTQLDAMTRDAEELLAQKKAPTKGEREVILNDIKRLRRELRSTIPFMSKMFNEQLDKTTTEAKKEVEAFVSNHIHHLGLTELQRQQQLGVLNTFDTNSTDSVDVIDAPVDEQGEIPDNQ